MVFPPLSKVKAGRRDTSLPPWQGRYRLITDRLRRPALYSVQGRPRRKWRTDAGEREVLPMSLHLGFAHGARYTAGAALTSVDTEGTDGTTRYAGALTDSQTSRMLSEKGINIFDVFQNPRLRRGAGVYPGFHTYRKYRDQSVRF